MYFQNYICNSKLVCLKNVAVLLLLYMFITEVSELQEVPHCIKGEQLELRPLVSAV